MTTGSIPVRKSTQYIERLENRQLLSAAHAAAADLAMGPFQTVPASPAVAHKAASKAGKRSSPGSNGGEATVAQASDEFLQPAQIQTIIADAASQARPGQTIAVVDREGTPLAVYQVSGGNPAYTEATEFLAIQRANTAAQFESTQDAFTTRTARFIIQNHFPQNIFNTPGGPLYGVEFSSFPGADILPADYLAGSIGLNVGLSGDPGGVPLFIDGVPVGAVGVAGDLHDQAPDADLKNVLENVLPANLVALGHTVIGLGHPAGQNYIDFGNSLGAYEKAAIGNRVFTGKEVSDFDESVALAGSAGFTAPPPIRATNIFVGSLALPYTNSPVARHNPVQTFDQLTSSGAGSVVAVPLVGKDASIIAGTPPVLNGTAGIPVADGGNGTSAGLYRLRSSKAAAAANVDIQGIPIGSTLPTTTPPVIAQNSSNEIVASSITSSPEITPDQVQQVINQVVSQALITRAGIRKPNGATAKIHVVVTDTYGNVLGVFSMQDATNFSYDVAVQKARTAAYFSDDSHAYTSTAIGFLSQGFFPIGINGGSPGPLYTLQDFLSDNTPNLVDQGPTGPLPSDVGPLPNGITIFPGGDPLYNSSGQLIGAVGVSGDGVNQDDLMCYAGTQGFQPPNNIRSDALAPADAANFLINKLQVLANLPGVNLGSFNVTKASHRLINDLQHTKIPYVKFPRNPTTL